jgi:hypothetical protein
MNSCVCLWDGFVDEIPDFERTWEEQEKMLPHWNKIGPLGIGSSQPAMSPTLRGEFQTACPEIGQKGN